MKCPHCNGENKLTVGYSNAEFYGSKRFIFECLHCNKMFSVYFSRQIIALEIKKEDDNAESDFGYHD